MSPHRRKFLHSNMYQNAGAYRGSKRHENDWALQRRFKINDQNVPRTLRGGGIPGRANFGFASTDRLGNNYRSGYAIANRGFERYQNNGSYQRRFIAVDYQRSSTFHKPDFIFGSNKRRLENDNENERDTKVIKLEDDENVPFIRRVESILEQRPMRATLLKEHLDSVLKLETVIDHIYRKAYKLPDETFGNWFVEDLALLCKECKEISVSRQIGDIKEIYTFEFLLVKKISDEYEKLVQLKQRIGALASISKGASEERKHKWIQLRYEEYLPVIRKEVYGRFAFIRHLFRNGMMSNEQVHSLMKSLIHLPEERNLECLKEFAKIMGKENEFQVDEQVNHPNPLFVELYNHIRAMFNAPNYTGNEKCILMEIIGIINQRRVQRSNKTAVNQ